MFELVKKQKEVESKLKRIAKNDTTYRIKNFLLVGDIGVGKTTLLKNLGKEKEFSYINFTKQHLNDFFREQNISFRYLTSNDFFKYLESKFIYSDSFLLLDSLEPIFIATYQNGGVNRLVTFMNNFFNQKFRKGLLLSIPNLKSINLKQIIAKSTFSDENILELKNDINLKQKLKDMHQLPNFKVDQFKNNHYFKCYKKGE
ncbi:MAG: AAA family ATPase [Bacillota bacterium]